MEKPEPPMIIRVLRATEGPAAVEVINRAAAWYVEFLAASELHAPEMTLEDWHAEARRMVWYGAFDGNELVGVMGLEYAGDVALLRHAYVLPERQREGVGALLLDRLERDIDGVDAIIVGTYAANHKARAALEKAGYRVSRDPDAVLRRYYDIPEDRLRSSVTYEKLRRPSLPPLVE